MAPGMLTAAVLLVAAAQPPAPTVFVFERGDRTIFTTRGDPRAVSGLRTKLGRCGAPRIGKLPDGRSEISISLESDDDYVLLDCIATQLKPATVIRRRPGATD